MWLVFAVGILVLCVFMLGIFVWLRGARSHTNISFAILSFATSLWMLFNFLGANFKESDMAIYAVRLDFVTGTVLAYAAWLFSAALLKQADTRKTHRRWYAHHTNIAIFTLSILAAIATLVSSVIDVTKQEGSPLAINYGQYYFVFALGLAAVVAAIMVNLYFARRLAKGRLRQQVSVMLSALLLSSVAVGFVNLALPQLSESAEINLTGGNLSYVGIAFFITATFYSIVKHRLFDLRLVIARSVAYLLLVGVLTVGYGLLTLLISNTLVKDYELTGRDSIVPIISIVLLAFTVNPLGKFFNRLTNKLFYKDSYEPQQLLGEVNQAIISNVDVDILLKNVANIMDKYLKTYYCLFDIAKTDHSIARTIDSGSDLSAAKLKVLFQALGTVKSGLIITDELSAEHEHLRKQLEVLNAGVVARLSTTHGQTLGYLLLGNKKNGSTYTSQDVEMITIATGELVIAIQNALRYEEIERFNATLQQKIEDATKRLRQTNTKLRMLDETKDDFISMASHQLRTPLTSVKGYVSMVLDGDAGKISPLQRKLLNQAFISSQRMVYLISDLLNVSRLRTGKFIIEPIATDLSKVIQDEAEQLQETAKSRNLTLVYHKPENFPVYMFDETKLRQVIMNFMDNAIYYTPSGGKIEVKLVDKPSSIEFTVIDNGIGVPKHEQHHLFSKFFRANNAKRARPDGTGLGLFMAKKVVIAQGGAIIFKSQEGKGSTFGFNFAKDKLQTPPQKPVS